MMLKTQTQAAAGSRAPVARRAAAAPLRTRRVCRAEPEQPKTAPIPESFQEPSGFVASDSAGQSNMYPVFTKAYASPTAAPGNTAFAVAAAAIAVAAIVVGLGALTTTGSGPTVDDFKALSEYAAIFSAEI
ncbi:MAG: hypothetical protein J3K34DRAFT_422888 [Monoraphidium minutum]|nr:MAG: hypothetical protein J3K34DRAFT_422888 [Monoraphidium minutum]